MERTYLLIGGNVGDRQKNLETAASRIGEEIGSLSARSSLYETEAWGKSDQPAFLNQVLQVDTELGPEDLLEAVLRIEQEMGRTRQEKYGPRTIDIDILLYKDLELEKENLVIPHPQLHLRRFALQPLAEIAPGLLHPFFKKSIDELLLECPDKLAVNKYG